jgi:hypothetical protein
MSNDNFLPFDLPAICRKKVSATFDGGAISSDGSLLLLREADRRWRPAGCPGAARRCARSRP